MPDVTSCAVENVGDLVLLHLDDLTVYMDKQLCFRVGHALVVASLSEDSFMDYELEQLTKGDKDD